MSDKSYANWSEYSDIAIEKHLGAFVKEMRQRQNKTQAELAKEADISRSTLSLLERGDAGTITTLIKLLRVLDQLHILQVFQVSKQISPLALAKLEQKPKQRVKKKPVNTDNISIW
jgi:transcriptional regulator with XRE-family HTH domain